MALSSPTYNRRVIFSWAFYDFANSSFTTLVVTFIYAAYFAKGIAPDEDLGAARWSNAVSITALIVAVLSPYVGAIADRGGYRKRFLLISTVVGVAATSLLFFPQPGQIFFALSVFVVANVAFEMGMVFYNAYLPDITPQDQIGKVSGYGWGLGYIGGLLCLIIALFAFVQTETPLFGFSTENGANIRATNLLVAVWFALFAIPIFLWVKDRPAPPLPKGQSVLRQANRQLVNTFHEIRQQYRQIFRFLVARLIYNDGLITIFSFGGIYAQNVFDFELADVIIFGIVLNVAAGLGALAFGFLDDFLGGKSTILITLAGLFCAGLLAVLTTSRMWFWAAAIVVGILLGPNQSASRSLMGRFVPAAKETEFYGFFGFSGKATAFLSPALFGGFTELFGIRAGMATVLLFFVVGGILLLRVNEKEGIELAQRPVDLASNGD
ncbi:MAG: MFS transporter [Rhodothermales bacterium]